MRIRYLIASALVVATLAIFWRVGNHDFVWSDRAVIAENVIERASRTAHAPAYGTGFKLPAPLTHSLWKAVAAVGNAGGEMRQAVGARPFHIVNTILHILNVLVVLALLRLLLNDDWAAGAGALLFALHPLHVEPVAWASATMHLLGGLLALVAIWQYLLYVSSMPSVSLTGHDHRGFTETLRSRSKRFHYGLAVCAFAGALLANPLAIAALPIAWILSYGLFERSLRQSLVSLVPWAGVALALAAAMFPFRPASQGAAGSPLWQRPLIAADAFAFYIYKLVLPLRLSVDYGRAPAAVAQQGWMYSTWIIPGFLALSVWLWRRSLPYLLTAAGVFAAGLLPVLGFFPFEFQNISTVADRYAYIALLGPALALGWALSRFKSKAVLAACAILLAAMGVKSVFQARLWENNITLFSHALALNSNSWVSHYNLGLAVARNGALEDAEQHYRAALKIKPDYRRAEYALANILAAQGRFDEAIERYRRVLHENTRAAEVHYYLGNVFAKLNRLGEAVEQYENSIKANPQNALAHGSLGHILFRQRKIEEAAVHYRKALEIEPQLADVHYGLANILAGRGELDEAMNHYLSALRINPSYAGAYYNLGTILARRGQMEEAIRYFRAALKIRPNFADAHESLGRALVLQGQREQGMQHIEQALRILKAGRGSETLP